MNKDSAADGSSFSSFSFPHCPLCLPRRHGHPGAGLRASQAASGREADRERGRPVRHHRRPADRAGPLRHPVSRAARGRHRRLEGAPLSSLLFGLGIRHVGKTVAVLLARRFGTMKALMKAAEDGIGGIQGIGPTIAEAVTGFFAEERNRLLIERLDKAGLMLKESKAAAGSGRLEGQTYVITGTLPTLSRAEATALIEEAGGRVSGSISKKTTALVAGADAGASWRRPKSSASR